MEELVGKMVRIFNSQSKIDEGEFLYCREEKGLVHLALRTPRKHQLIIIILEPGMVIKEIDAPRTD